jgi:hypothetical protein
MLQNFTVVPAHDIPEDGSVKIRLDVSTFFSDATHDCSLTSGS